MTNLDKVKQVNDLAKSLKEKGLAASMDDAIKQAESIIGNIDVQNKRHDDHKKGIMDTIKEKLHIGGNEPEIEPPPLKEEIKDETQTQLNAPDTSAENYNVSDDKRTVSEILGEAGVDENALDMAAKQTGTIEEEQPVETPEQPVETIEEPPKLEQPAEEPSQQVEEMKEAAAEPVQTIEPQPVEQTQPVEPETQSVEVPEPVVMDEPQTPEPEVIEPSQIIEEPQSAQNAPDLSEQTEQQTPMTSQEMNEDIKDKVEHIKEEVEELKEEVQEAEKEEKKEKKENPETNIHDIFNVSTNDSMKK